MSEQPLYLLVIVGAALLTVVYARAQPVPRRTLLVADALGLALFTVSGAQVPEALGLSPVIVVLMGAMTGSAGGILRDLLCGEIPLILRRDVYATASILGGTAYVCLRAAGMDADFAGPIAMIVVVAVRLAAILRRLHFPAIVLRRDDGTGP
ncbi:MAG: trimeric intracellular cation channel family protein [Gemmatimonadetes bacterium]|nr:trimeric intracellular cation channel family protein [Gemmatimonadota bacterium]